jgi:hypothetical protein
LATKIVVEELPPTPKSKKKKTLASVFTLPRKRTRSASSIATIVIAPAVTTSMSTTSSVEPTITQKPPISAIDIQAPTVTASELAQKRKRQTRGKSQRVIDRVAPGAT